MNYFIILSSITFTSFIIIGVYIISFKPRTGIHVLFFIKSLILASLILTGLIIQLSHGLAEMVFWHKMNLSQIALFTAVMLHFYIILTKTDMGIRYQILLYLPSIAVIFMIFKFPSTISHINILDNGLWLYKDDFGLLSLKAYIVHVTVYPAIVLYLIYRWGKNSRYNKIKRQSRILFIGIIATLVISDVCDLLLSRFTFYKLPHILFIMFLVYFFALAYTLVRYSFMKFSMSDIAGEIIANIQDMILVLNPDRTIMDANVSFVNKVVRRSNSLRNMGIRDFIVADDTLDKKLDELQAAKISSFNSRIIYKSDPANIVTDSYISRISDSFNDFIGILVISKESRSLLSMRSQYRITEKQFRIMELLINGHSNREISEMLSIHKRTVETHVLSIYTKLGIKNRIELLNLVSEYNMK